MCVKLLRSKREGKNHNRAMALQKYLPKRSFFSRLFHINFHTAHITPGESIRRKYIGDKRLNLDNTDRSSGDAKEAISSHTSHVHF